MKSVTTAAAAKKANYEFQVGMTVVTEAGLQGKIEKIKGQAAKVKIGKGAALEIALSTLTPLAIFQQQNKNNNDMAKGFSATRTKKQAETVTAVPAAAPSATPAEAKPAKRAAVKAAAPVAPVAPAKEAKSAKGAAKKAAAVVVAPAAPAKVAKVAENTGKRGGAIAHADTVRKVLTVEEQLEIEQHLRNGGMTYKQIAEAYGLQSMTPIAHIKRTRIDMRLTEAELKAKANREAPKAPKAPAAAPVAAAPVVAPKGKGKKAAAEVAAPAAPAAPAKAATKAAKAPAKAAKAAK